MLTKHFRGISEVARPETLQQNRVTQCLLTLNIAAGDIFLLPHKKHHSVNSYINKYIDLKHPKCHCNVT